MVYRLIVQHILIVSSANLFFFSSASFTHEAIYVAHKIHSYKKTESDKCEKIDEKSQRMTSQIVVH